MLFNSPIYIFLFLPLAVSVYFLLNRRRLITAGKAWLVFASLVFYGYWNPVYLGLILSSILVNYVVGRELHRTGGEHIPSPRCRGLLLFGVLFNLGLLGYFKYADFFLANMNTVLGSDVALLNLALPLAISFFTFQQIAYLADSYKADTQEYDFLNYCLFVTFFPQLIAGPIVHHKQMMPQFKALRNKVINWENVATGLFIFFAGLFKKVVIADTLADWANIGFDEWGILSAEEAWATIFAYTFQLYFDFSGYTDMAIGAALMCNIRLPINFNSPYKAKDINELWRRWHMTLTGWLREYVYIPLGGSRRGAVLTYFNLFITFVLAGLWHGAGWTFVVFGALHGAALCVQRMWNRAGFALPNVPAWALTFFFWVAALALFRATNFDDAIRVLQGMTGMNGLFAAERIEPWMFGEQAVTSFITWETWAYIAASAFIALLLPNTVQMIGFVEYEGKFHFKITPLTALGVGLLMGIGLLAMLMTDGAEFLYFNF